VEISIAGRGVIPGRTSGYALVCPRGITGWGGIDPVTGVIKEYDNVNRGESIKGRILVMPGSKGSNGWSCYFGVTRVSGASPKGFIFTNVDSSCAVAAVCLRIPTIVDFPPSQDPCQAIENGDFVIMDGGTGEVTVTKKSREGR
jgi:predicted aconitase with swiveling domain